MNKVRAVRTFVVFWLPGGMFLNFLLLFFVDGNRKITIVNKRLKHRASKHNTRPEATSVKEYIVDVRMGRRKSLRSLYCSLSMYKKFREGNTYEVVVKRDRVKSIVEPNKKQGEITSALQYNYPIFTDDFMLRMDPGAFESLRSHYQYRREFYID